MDECRSLKVRLFDNFKKICNSLNELYDFRDNKPTNYSPENSHRINITQNTGVFKNFDDLDL